MQQEEIIQWASNTSETDDLQNISMYVKYNYIPLQVPFQDVNFDIL